MVAPKKAAPKKQVARRKPSAPAVAPEYNPKNMLQIAVERGDDLAYVEQLMGLAERYNTEQARMAYVTALANFKADPPVIVKDKHVHYTTSKGDTDYKHASLDQLATVLGKALSAHGLSFTWKSEQGEGGLITVTCILSHALGHSETTSLSASPDQSGGKNNIQAVGSTNTYLQRYTLRSITGTAEADMDDDGKAGGTAPVETITAEQVKKIEALIKEHGVDRDGFMLWVNNTIRVSEIDQIPAEWHKNVIAAINNAIAHKEKTGDSA